MIRRIAELMGFPKRNLDVEFFAPLSVEECKKRFLHAEDNLTDKRVVVVIDGDRFSIRKRQFITNRLIPLLLNGYLTPVPQGTRVTGRLVFHPVAVALTIFVLGYIGISLCNHITFSPFFDWSALAWPVGMFFLAILVYQVGLWISRSSGPYLVDWLHKALEVT